MLLFILCRLLLSTVVTIKHKLFFLGYYIKKDYIVVKCTTICKTEKRSVSLRDFELLQMNNISLIESFSDIKLCGGVDGEI